jgi:hypothetical protein
MNTRLKEIGDKRKARVTYLYLYITRTIRRKYELSVEGIPSNVGCD